MIFITLDNNQGWRKKCHSEVTKVGIRIDSFEAWLCIIGHLSNIRKAH